LQWEIGNAFSAMFKRKKITLEQAIIGFEIFQKIPIEYPPIDFYHALSIAHKNGIYAYDAYFLTLSQKHKCPFIALDKSLKDIALKIDIKIIEVKVDYL
jgi:predicted nucleic acid-binding protein